MILNETIGSIDSFTSLLVPFSPYQITIFQGQTTFFLRASLLAFGLNIYPFDESLAQTSSNLKKGAIERINITRQSVGEFGLEYIYLKVDFLILSAQTSRYRFKGVAGESLYRHSAVHLLVVNFDNDAYHYIAQVITG